MSFIVQGNPVIFIESTIHAREWISAATVSYLVNQLLTSNDTEIQKLAQNYDWIIVPILNVDGYDYTHQKVCTTNSLMEETILSRSVNKMNS